MFYGLNLLLAVFLQNVGVIVVHFGIFWLAFETGSAKQ